MRSMTIQSLTADNERKDHVLTVGTWMTSLLRGPHKDAFRALWDKHAKLEIERTI